eukprot:gene6775-7875_t
MLGALCQSAMYLIVEKSLPRSLVAQGFKEALGLAINYLDDYAVDVVKESVENQDDNKTTLQSIGECSLNSKIIGHWKKELTELCIKAIQRIESADDHSKVTLDHGQPETLAAMISSFDDGRADLEQVEMMYVVGGTIEETRLISGVVMSRFFSHENMPKMLSDVKVAVVSAPLELAKPATTHSIHLSNSEQLDDMLAMTALHHAALVSRFKEVGARLVICQWGIDGEVASALALEGIAAVSWVAGSQLERIASCTNASICTDILSLEASMLGHATQVSEVVLGNQDTRYIIVEGAHSSATQTLLIRGGSTQMCQETLECAKDCLNVLANVRCKPRVVAGGGAAELYLYSQLRRRLASQSTSHTGVDVAIKGWSESMLSIPSCLLENAGLDSQDLLPRLINLHQQSLDKDNTHSRMVANLSHGSSLSTADDDDKIIDASKHNLWELLDQKKSILKLATHTACMLIQIDQFLST